MVVGQQHERQQLAHRCHQPGHVGHPQAAMPARHQHPLHVAHAQPGHAQQQFLRRAVQIHRETLGVADRPGHLRVDVQVQHAVLGGVGDLLHAIAVETQQPVGLVQAVLALQGWRLQGQLAAGIGNGAEGRVIDPAHAVVAIQGIGAGQDLLVVGPVGADDHLRALPGRGEARRARARAAGGQRRDHGRRLACLLGLLDAPAQLAHRATDRLHGLFRCQRAQAGLGRQLHVDRQPVGIAPGTGQQLGRGLGNGLEVDVTGVAVFLAQLPRHFHHLFHGVVGIADDAAGKEQALDVVALVEVQGQCDHFVHAEARPRHVAGHAVHAVGAVVDAEVGQQDLQQRHTTAIGRVAVADAHAFGAADAAAGTRIPLARAAGGAGGVVLGGVGQDGQLADGFH